MSSSSFASTVDLQLRPSTRALKLLLPLHLFPVGLLPFAMQPGVPMALLAGAFMLSWVWLRRHPVFGFGPRALTRIVWHAEGEWAIHDAAGEHAAELLGSSYVHPQLMVLNFRLNDGGSRSRAILGDETPEDLLRRLRARLSTADSA